MENNNYNHTPLKLYTNSLKIQNLWLLLGNKNLVPQILLQIPLLIKKLTFNDLMY